MTISRFITRKGTHNFDLLIMFMPSFDLWLKKASSDSLVNLFGRSGSCLSAVLGTGDFLPEAWFLLLGKFLSYSLNPFNFDLLFLYWQFGWYRENGSFSWYLTVCGVKEEEKKTRTTTLILQSLPWCSSKHVKKWLAETLPKCGPQNLIWSLFWVTFLLKVEPNHSETSLVF